MTIAQTIAGFAQAAETAELPRRARETLRLLLLDVAGLCLAARANDYVTSARASIAAQGRATVIGQAQGASPYDAALVNGTAAHGEDYDDTFEGGPIHAGAVVVPALLASAERHRIAGPELLYGMAVGLEVTCRASLVAPKRLHQAGFHPTAVLGAMGAAAGVAAALGADARTFACAQGIAGSLASGIIEYLAEGTSTKRLHPGWAAQSGIRAVELARAGFDGPRTVWEGTHGMLHAFARDAAGDWTKLLDGFGERWVASTIAFKPYACGTMIHPYIDCARRISLSLGRGLGRGSQDIVAIECETAEAIVHRLWEPLAAKRAPANGYAAKFSVPYCVAHGLVHGAVGLDAFDDRPPDPRVASLAAKVEYRIDPANPYPDEYTGHVRVRFADGSVREERQPHLRGGRREPLSRAEIEEKFLANCASGRWPETRSRAWLAFARRAFDAPPIDLTPFRG